MKKHVPPPGQTPAKLNAANVAAAVRPLRLAICMPVYNEALTLPATLTELAAAVGQLPEVTSLDVVVVDDGSQDESVALAEATWRQLRPPLGHFALHVIPLAANQGHQRALLCGLRQVATLGCDFCLVMDADGQDDPAALKAMLAATSNSAIVFAQRAKRAEGPLWVLLYWCYQMFFRLLLGQTLYFGNFSLLAAKVVRQIIREGDLRHLAAVLSASEFSKTSVPVARRERRAGQTKMSLLRLVDYGIAAMTTSSQLWIRLFTRFGIIMAGLSLAVAAGVVAIRLFTDLAISGWASIICLICLSISFQAFSFLAITAFLHRITAQVAPTQFATLPKRTVNVGSLVSTPASAATGHRPSRYHLQRSKKHSSPGTDYRNVS